MKIVEPKYNVIDCQNIFIFFAIKIVVFGDLKHSFVKKNAIRIAA